jgi:hypothetical protein
MLTILHLPDASLPDVFYTKIAKTFERPGATGNAYRFEVGIKKVCRQGEMKRHPLRRFTVDDVSRHLKP